MERLKLSNDCSYCFVPRSFSACSNAFRAGLGTSCLASATEITTGFSFFGEVVITLLRKKIFTETRLERARLRSNSTGSVNWSVAAGFSADKW